MRRHAPKATFIPIIGLLIFAGTLFLIFYSTGWFAKKSAFFKVKEIFIHGDDGVKISLDYLKGRGIFSVDLKKEEDFALRNYPICKTVKIIKVFPNRIFADFALRKPVAYVRLYKYFYVDEDGILFDASSGPEQFDGSATSIIDPERIRRNELPVILGLDAKIFGPKNGQRCQVKELTTALKIIKAIKNNVVLRELTVKRVDAADIGSVTVFFTLFPEAENQALDKTALGAGILEVKFGQWYINEKADILGNLFVQGKKDLDNIKYIDLRFNDPVIKFKEQ